MEKGHQKRGDMRAINIGIGHDNHALIAQFRLIILARRATTQRLHEVSNLLALLQFSGGGIGDIQDFTAQRQNGLVAPIARLLGTTASAIAFHNEYLRVFGGILRTICQFSGQAQLTRGGFAVNIALLAAANTVFGAFAHPFQQFVAFLR